MAPEQEKVAKSAPKSSLLLILLIVLAVVIVGGGAYLWWQNRETTTTTSTSSSSSTSVSSSSASVASSTASITSSAASSSSSSVAAATAGWKTYTNSTHGYSIKYPTDWRQSISRDISTLTILESPEATRYNDAGRDRSAYWNVLINYYNNLGHLCNGMATANTALRECLETTSGEIYSNVQTATIAGISGFKADERGEDRRISYYVINNGHVYGLSFNVDDYTGDEGESGVPRMSDAMISTMLGSFEFTD